MMKNIILETLEYNLKDIVCDNERGVSIDQFLYDKETKKLNIPKILYLLSIYMDAELFEHKILYYQRYWVCLKDHKYTFVSSGIVTPEFHEITVKSNIWLECKLEDDNNNNINNLEKYDNKNKLKARLYAYLIRECFYSYITKEENYVPDEFYYSTMLILFLFVPNAFKELALHWDEQNMYMCKDALRDVLLFADQAKKYEQEPVTNGKFITWLLEGDREIGYQIKNAMEEFVYDIDPAKWDWAWSLLLDDIRTFNNVLKTIDKAKLKELKEKLEVNT